MDRYPDTTEDILTELHRFLPQFKQGCKVNISLGNNALGVITSNGPTTLISKKVDSIANDVFYTMRFENDRHECVELKFHVSKNDISPPSTKDIT